MSSRERRKQAARAVRQLSAERRLRRRRLWTSVVAVAVLLAAGTAGVVAWQAGRPDQVDAPSVATADRTGLAVGTGPVTVELYFDFLCPACRQFEQAAGPVLDDYLAAGRITLVYRPIAILDRLTSTAYSTRAGAAGACAAEGGKLSEFAGAMWDRQPAEGSAGLPDEEIVRIGTGVGLASDTFGECVRGDAYHAWMTSNTEAAAGHGVQSTPTVVVDGTRLTELSVPRLTAAIDGA